MTARAAAARIAVTGTGLVCPAAASVAGLLAASAVPGRSRAQCTGCWFDPVPYLGRHGWKYLSPATRYLLAAAALALDDADLNPRQRAPESMAVAVGTNFASSALVARFDRAVLSDGSGALSPAEAPNFSVNMPASQVSMRYAMRGFNLSLTNPMVAGIEAVLTLSSALRADRAESGLAGAAEECPDTLPGLPRAPAEGACCLTLELLSAARARGQRVRAEVAGGFSRFLPPLAAARGPDAEPGVWESAVGRPLTAALRGVSGPVPFALVPGTSGLARRIGGYCLARCLAAGVRLCSTRYLGGSGDHFTVSALLQAAGLINEHGHGLVVCASPHGHVAALYLRPPGAAGSASPEEG